MEEGDRGMSRVECKWAKRKIRRAPYPRPFAIEANSPRPLYNALATYTEYSRMWRRETGKAITSLLIRIYRGQTSAVICCGTFISYCVMCAGWFAWGYSRLARPPLHRSPFAALITCHSVRYLGRSVGRQRQQRRLAGAMYTTFTDTAGGKHRLIAAMTALRV